MFQAKQKQLHASTGLETPLPKMPKGGETAVKSRSAPPAPATTQAAPAPAVEQAAAPAAAPSKPVAGKKEGEKEKEYTELPVDALDVSKLTAEQKDHFKAKMFGAKLVRHENG